MGKPVIVHMYGGAPPVAETETEYAMPTVPFGREVVLMPRGLMEMVNMRLAVTPLASVTPTVTEEEVVTAGVASIFRDAREAARTAWAGAVPEMVSVVVSALTEEVRPGGKPLTVHLNGALPPATLIAQL